MSMNNEGPTDERGLTPEQARKAWEEAQIKDSKNYSEASKSNLGMTKDDDPVTVGMFRQVLEDVSTQFTNVLKQYQSNADKRLNDFSMEIQNLVKTNKTVDKDEKSDLLHEIVGLAKDYLKKDSQSEGDELMNQIKQRSKDEALESLDIVSLINKKVKQSLVGDIAANIADNVIVKLPQHGP